MELKDCIKRFEDNSIDHAASAEAFANALVAFEVEEAARKESLKGVFEAIDTTVTAIFDENKGKSIPTPALVSFTMNRLPAGMVTLENHKEMSKNVLEFIQASSLDGGSLQSKKGPGGGVRRICDIPPSETK